MNLKHAGASLAAIALAITLTGCGGSDATPERTVITSSPAAETTPTPTPTPTAEPGTRANPLQPGELMRLSADSMWTVGSTAPTVNNGSYIVLPLQLDLDWEAARAQGLDPENEGSDPSFSLTIDYVTADGRTFNTMDDYSVANTWYEVGVVYPPTATVQAGVPISVPADQIVGGVWKVSNSVGSSVFIVGAQ